MTEPSFTDAALNPGRALASVPEQLWEGDWFPAPDQPVDADGRYLPKPPPEIYEA